MATSSTYEGCVITSMTPICDAHEGTAAVEFAADDYISGSTPNPGFPPDETGFLAHPLIPNCVACKMKGTMHSLIHTQTYIYIYIIVE